MSSAIAECCFEDDGKVVFSSSPQWAVHVSQCTRETAGRRLEPSLRTANTPVYLAPTHQHH